MTPLNGHQTFIDNEGKEGADSRVIGPNPEDSESGDYETWSKEPKEGPTHSNVRNKHDCREKKDRLKALNISTHSLNWAVVQIGSQGRALSREVRILWELQNSLSGGVQD